MAAAVEDQYIQFFFQLLHRIGDGRGHAVQFFRRRGKTALAINGIQHGQGIKGQAHNVQ